MNELIRKADDLLNKIERVVGQQEKLQAALKEKNDEISALQKQLKDQQAQMEQLRHAAAVRRIGEVLAAGPAEKKELRKKLNDYIREVDRVIEKLSSEG